MCVVCANRARKRLGFNMTPCIWVFKLINNSCVIVCADYDFALEKYNKYYNRNRTVLTFWDLISYLEDKYKWQIDPATVCHLLGDSKREDCEKILTSRAPIEEIKKYMGLKKFHNAIGHNFKYQIIRRDDS